MLRTETRAALNLPTETPLLPGTDIGVLDLSCKNSNFSDFEWPALHTVLVRERVLEFFQEYKITGWQSAPVRIEGTRYLEYIPTMYQLLITGHGGVPVTNPPVEELSYCDACGRTEYKRGVVHSFQMDLSQWDGSDIFRFAAPYNGYVFVTQRLADGLRKVGFHNYELVTVEGFLAARAAHVFA
jgi:hypothetical protein